MNAPKAPPGWYEDPNRPNEKRWWDGDQWTNDFRSAPNGQLADHSAPVDSAPATSDFVPKPETAEQSNWFRNYQKAFMERLWVKVATGFAILLLLVAVFGGSEESKEPARSVSQSVVPPDAEEDDEGPSRAEQRQAAKRKIAAVVRAYYASLNDEEFSQAWKRLSSSLRSEMSGFETWRDGYSTTLSTKPTSVRVTELDGDEATVKVQVRSQDEDVCGDTVKQRFAGKWHLSKAGGRWVATDISMRRVAGSPPTDDYADCEEPESMYTPEEEDDSGDSCDPEYEGACIPVGVGDLDCPDVGAQGFRSIGSDPHRFDADGDGVACEG